MLVKEEDCMPMQLYFAADLTAVLLSLPEPAPASLWFQPKAARPGEPKPALRALWLLTPETLARCIYQCKLLRQRADAGNAPASHAAQADERLKPLVEFGIEAFGPEACFAATLALNAAGGPRGKLPRPDPLPPSPFDCVV